MDLIIRDLGKLENDKDFLVDAIWVLSYLSENYKPAIQSFLKLGGLQKIIKFLE